MTLPEYRTVFSENIPEELKALKIWVVWKPRQEKGKPKPGKIPMSWQNNKATGEKEVKAAACDKPETWMSFEDADRLCKSSRVYKGLQISLAPEIPEDDTDRLIGIDIDQAVLPDGSVKPELLEEIKAFHTYTELSPTNGLRGFCYGNFPVNEGVHNGNIEIYQYGKFLTVTGHKLADVPATVNPAQEAITAFRAKYFKPLPEIDETNLPVTSVIFTDEQIVSRLSTCKLSNAFKDLYYKGSSEEDDHSVKDKDLCKLIVFYTQDIKQIDRIFRKSALMREKWGKIHGHDENGPVTYGQITIKYALKTRTTVFRNNKYIISSISVTIYNAG